MERDATVTEAPAFELAAMEWEREGRRGDVRRDDLLSEDDDVFAGQPDPSLLDNNVQLGIEVDEAFDEPIDGYESRFDPM
jgi:hypothetical protein